MTDQYAEGKRWVFSFDSKEESEDKCLTAYFKHQTFPLIDGILSTEEQQGSLLRRGKCTKL